MDLKTTLMATLAVALLPVVARAPLLPESDFQGRPSGVVAVVPAPLRTPAANRKKWEVLAIIHSVNPDVPATRAVRLAELIVDECVAHRLEPLVLAAILAQESHFNADLQSCHLGGCDLGIAQINWETWGAERHLDRRRLVSDDGYGIRVAAGILAELRRRHGEAPRWWTRYHDRRDELRDRYAARVASHVPGTLGRL